MKLKFSKKLYPLPAIERASKAFKDLAHIRIRQSGGSIGVTFDRIKPGFKDRLADEFSNYVLSEINP